MVPFTIAYLAGYLANKYNVSADASQPRAIDRIGTSVASDFRNTVVGYSSVRPLSENTGTLKASHKYALYPVYLLNTTWNGKNYLFAMNGQSGKFIGNLPFSIKEALKLYFPLAGIISLIAYIIFYLFL